MQNLGGNLHGKDTHARRTRAAVVLWCWCLRGREKSDEKLKNKFASAGTDPEPARGKEVSKVGPVLAESIVCNDAEFREASSGWVRWVSAAQCESARFSC